MGWLKLITGFVSLMKHITGFVRDRQLIKSGEARAAAKQSKKSLDIVSKAQKARRSVARADPDSMRNDPANRDG